MAKMGKWIGGALGWAFLGPIGGLFGFLIGTAVDEAKVDTGRKYGTTTTGDFIMSLLVLVAAVMKADGKILKSELDYVKKYFVSSFDPTTAAEALKLLRDLLKKDIPVDDICQQIRLRMDYSSRLQLMHFLYGIAKADQHIDYRETKLIDHISVLLGINDSDRSSIKSMFVEETDTAYKVLGIDKDASDYQVKSAYRRMANKYHPDKVAYLGEEFKEAASEKFQKVNEAYEKIKKERGMN